MFRKKAGQNGSCARASEKPYLLQRHHTDVSLLLTGIYVLLLSFTLFSYRPSGSRAVSPADRDIVLGHGIAVVDCSWAQLSSVPFHIFPKANQRLCKHLLGHICVHFVVFFSDFFTTLLSAIPGCREFSKLRQAMAFELCRSLCSMLFHLWI